MRKIIHIDMDCFYAAVEMRDNPSLRRRPVAVGGAPDKRGVLSTCNYEARKCGLHSAMPTARALRLCPSLVLLPVDMEKYREASAHIHDIFYAYTDVIEPLSLDEAYLDVSDSTECGGSATLLATKIREEIVNRVELTASGGIAPNKFLAKVASDWNKPNGQFSIPPKAIEAFIKSLPVKKIPGVGRISEKKLQARGIVTCEDLQALSTIELHEEWGKLGDRLYGYCRGIDDRPVESSRIRKSVSVEHTFVEDLEKGLRCEEALIRLQDDLRRRLKKHRERVIHKQFVKIKWANFRQITRECVVSQFTPAVFLSLLREAMERLDKPVRLIGVGVRFSEVEPEKGLQGELLL